MKCFKTLNNAKGTANVKSDFLFLLCFLLQTMQLYLSGFFPYQFVEILLGRVNLSIGRDSPSNLVYIAQCWPLFNWRLNIVSYFSTICLINFVRKLILSNLFLSFSEWFYHWKQIYLSNLYNANTKFTLYEIYTVKYAYYTIQSHLLPFYGVKCDHLIILFRIAHQLVIRINTSWYMSFNATFLDGSFWIWKVVITKTFLSSFQWVTTFIFIVFYAFSLPAPSRDKVKTIAAVVRVSKTSQSSTRVNQY